MPNKEIFVLKIVWKKSIALLHRLTQAVQRANLRRTAGDPTWVMLLSSIIFHPIFVGFCLTFDANYRNINAVWISVDFCLTFDANKYLLIGHLWEFYNKGLDVPSSRDICFENSLKEIHSFAPSFNPSRATH